MTQLLNINTARSLKLRFNLDDAEKAADEWGFNCGPAALCAVLGLTPEEVRPHMGDFERKRYTNPTLMFQALRSLNVRVSKVFQCLGANRPGAIIWPKFGLVRIQWGGPWTKPGVPVRARYRHTHWIAVSGSLAKPSMAFDVNAMCVGGWLGWGEWRDRLVPWLLNECEPKASGEWWATHCLEIRDHSNHESSIKSI